ncbi:hypothetical protein UM396_02850 [Geobacillus subterraneus]|jgi:hypothetical protein|uniref:Uncharacterized protein n=1 Tax=Geobacillus kaustophilus (strain HTA426) TaxID=235909 RepID=Q5L2P6_GEOKA|nr:MULTISPECIES: hypothetical protein [Geobacillus]WPZ18880.1 hypothetical protein UM396_02850 [Geobacillus subterraneus]BAD74784.1 hypothetical protein GK0499 [Geobacillus kaustophilus HTA426]
MYEPKAVDHITSNGRHILIYDYLDYPVTIMLANDIVVGINPEADEICLMVPDQNNVYRDITDIISTKPTMGAIELFLKADNLWAVESYKNAKQIGKQILNKSLTELKLCYSKR